MTISSWLHITDPYDSRRRGQRGGEGTPYFYIAVKFKLELKRDENKRSPFRLKGRFSIALISKQNDVR
jgi:hypothetical protein